VTKWFFSSTAADDLLFSHGRKGTDLLLDGPRTPRFSWVHRRADDVFCYRRPPLWLRPTSGCFGSVMQSRRRAPHSPTRKDPLSFIMGQAHGSGQRRPYQVSTRTTEYRHTRWERWSDWQLLAADGAIPVPQSPVYSMEAGLKWTVTVAACQFGKGPVSQPNFRPRGVTNVELLPSRCSFQTATQQETTSIRTIQRRFALNVRAGRPGIRYLHAVCLSEARSPFSGRPRMEPDTELRHLSRR
jgi:hypothetical protein